MRITTHFHDYYDCMMAYGVDHTLIYVRKPEIIEKTCVKLTDKGFRGSGGWHGRRRQITVVEHVIGFCGKVYPFLHVTSDKDYDAEAFCYNVEEVDAFVESNFKKKEIACYYNTEKVYRKTEWAENQRRQVFEEYFKEMDGKEDSKKQYFLDHNVPIFISSRYNGRQVSQSNIVHNGCLKEFEFYRIMEPFVAYQELQMFMTGILGLTNNHKAKYQGQLIEPEVDDITKRDSKGFNNWSFRKPPSKNK